MKITITANDGTEFGTKEECMTYEDGLAKKEKLEQEERERLLTTKTELHKEIENIVSELNDKVSDYRKLPSSSIRYDLDVDDDSKLCVEFDNSGRVFASGYGNPLIDLLMRM